MQARTVAPPRGWQWILGGFALWRRNPMLLSAASMSAIMLLYLVGALPFFGGPMVFVIVPTVLLTVIHVCQLIARDQRLTLQALRIPRPALINLLILGAMMGVGMLAVQGINQLIVGDTLAQMMETAQQTGQPPVDVPPELLWAVLVKILVITVVTSLLWFAPMLSGLRGVSPPKALFFTVVALWRNKGAFLVLGLGLMALCLPLSLLFALGQFGQSLAMMVVAGVFWPLMYAINYVSLVDIFGDLFDKGDGS